MEKDGSRKKPTTTHRISNKKARFDYDILETVEAGLVLKGSEVKSLRFGEAALADAYARVERGKATLHNFQIQPYQQATVWNHDPKRVKVLLLHKREIKKLETKVVLKGLTLVPLSVYFNDKGVAKVELALAKGKSVADKRQSSREREDRKEIKKEMTRATRRGGL